jgi:hypothetical protein
MGLIQEVLGRGCSERGNRRHQLRDLSEHVAGVQVPCLPPTPSAPARPSADAAPAIATMTTGVAIPSLRPLSTVISRRIREGTAGLVTTGTPSAASVGANAAAIGRASHRPIPGNSNTASSQPAKMVSGRPTPSNRTYCPMP